MIVYVCSDTIDKETNAGNIIMEKIVLEFIKKNNMFTKGDKVLVGVSGGADSVCLLFVLYNLKEELNISLSAVHVHHGLRGEEADHDAQYAAKLCEKLNIECEIKYVDVKSAAIKNHQSTEEAARILRYKVFDEMAQKYNCNKIAVAHHEDDQAETMLFQMFRGSGLKGLAGISPVRERIVRPLLSVDKRMIEKYLETKNIKYCIDSTNLSTDYSRNKLRNQMLPFIKENINQKVVKHLAALAEDTREANEYIYDQAVDLYEKYKLQDETYNNCVVLSTDIFNEKAILVKYVLRICINEITDTMKDITRKHIESIFSLAEANGYKEIILPYNVCVVKNYDKIIFRKGQLLNEKIEETLIRKKDILYAKEPFILQKGGKNIIFSVRERKKVENIEKKAYTKYLDYDKIEDVFAVRVRKSGDFLVINENGGKKKLKDYFIDTKIPKNLRDYQILLADNSHIIWVIGYRISEDVKITDETVRILEIEVQ